MQAIYYREKESQAESKGTAKADGQAESGILKNMLKKFIWTLCHLLLFALAGILVTVLLDGSARNALSGMLSL